MATIEMAGRDVVVAVSGAVLADALDSAVEDEELAADDAKLSGTDNRDVAFGAGW